MRTKLSLLFAILGIVMTFTFQHPAFAVIDSPCVDCHTMHNSQNGTSMNFDNSPTPNIILLRADCFGCHARGITENIDPLNGAPQVSHTNATDLAGGNFAYITGGVGGGASDAKGHNVIELGNNDDVLTFPPPGPHPQHPSNIELTCAGRHGCHGFRGFSVTNGLASIKGSHHQNVDGKVDTATETYNSYRFLRAVKGLEDSDWQATTGPTDHNEYFGATTPMPGDQTTCSNCHGPPHQDMFLRPDNNTISGLCATCHGNFHFVNAIGGDTSSPFTRHPSDVVLKGSGEYANYTSYSLEAPIARTTVPDTPSATVTPGTDVVMCLSCHAVHGTDYPDILKWDYTTMIAGGSGTGGCFTCHTQKN